ncbi:MAG TPA: tetratricopeptide repeat protein, partial [Lacipirellulaceae bacterium]|nr:tetratricopeptide repeat protein [Lacipirellulaceae bacterium]
EKVIGSVSPTDQALNWRWHPPHDTPRDVRRRLIDEERRVAIVERWPKLPQPALHGKSALEAAGDPEFRIPLMASVLVLEQGGNIDRDADSIAELRRELHLPQPETIEPGDQPMSALPLVRVSRLNVTALVDDDLIVLYRRSILVGAHAATLRLAREAAGRPSVADRIPPADAYQRMIAAERDPDRALVLINAAREHSKAAGQSTASWDLAELELHITTGNVDEAKEMLARIERDHRDDPQVVAALYQLLYETGIIADQQPVHAHAHEMAPAATAAGASEPGGSRIWTPDSDRPSGGKSTLWTPS